MFVGAGPSRPDVVLHSTRSAVDKRKIPSPSPTPSQPCPRCSEPHPRTCGGLAAANPPAWSRLTFQISPGGERGTFRLRSSVPDRRHCPSWRRRSVSNPGKREGWKLCGTVSWLCDLGELLLQDSPFLPVTLCIGRAPCSILKCFSQVPVCPDLRI